MESDNMGCIVFTTLMIGIFAIYGLLKKANEWFFMRKLDLKVCINLPPGNLGLPFIGNMTHFIKCFKYGDPNAFTSSFAKRYGDGGMYKAHLFGKPSIVVTTAETCKKVLMDDEHFMMTLPKSVTDLIARRLYDGLSFGLLKNVRRITISSIASQEALSQHVDTIKDIAISTWDRLDSNNNNNNEPLELLAEMRKYAVQVILSVILGESEIDQNWFDVVQREFSIFSDGFFVLPINLPGLTYYKASKARDKLCVTFEKLVKERRLKNERAKSKIGKVNMLDEMLASEDEEGRKFSDEKIAGFIILFAFGALLSTAVVATWALIYLQQNPQVLHKAKKEVEDIIKRRPSSQKGLSGNEVREMKYLFKVIDETLRLVNPLSPLHRMAIKTINMNGYIIPKGWNVLTWTRHVHMDPTYYPNPEDFNPSRWDDHVPKPGVFAPFGMGHGMCPGADLAKFEISVLLYYFLLDYGMERINPKGKAQFFPAIKHDDNCLVRIKKLTNIK